MRLFSRSVPPAIAYVACTFVDKAFSFITIPLMAMYVPPGDYGRYDLAISLVEFFSVVFSLGLGDTLIRFTSPIMDPAQRQRLLAQILGVGVLLAASLGALVLWATPEIAHALGITMDVTALRLSLAAIMVGGVLDIPLVWMRMHGHAGRFLVITAVRAVLLASGVVIALTSGYGVEGVMISNALVVLSIAIVLIALQIRDSGISISRVALGRVLRFGIPLIGGSLCLFALGALNRWFLPGQVTLEQIGTFGLAVRLTMVTALFLTPFTLWWYPHRIKVLSGPDGLRQCANYWGLGYGILIVGAAATALFGPLFVELALPPTYAHVNQLLPLAAANQVFMQLAYLSNIGCYARNSGFRVLQIDMIGAAVAVAGYFLLIPHWAIYGVLASMIAGHAVRLVLFLIAGHVTAPIPYPYLGAGICAVAAALATWLAPTQSDIFMRTLWGTVSIAMLAALLLQFRVVQLPEAWTQGAVARVRNALGK